MHPDSRAGRGYLRRRERLLVQLQLVTAALAQHDEWEANCHLPPEVRRDLPEPPFSRPVLAALHRMLAEELGHLEDDWPQRN